MNTSLTRFCKETGIPKTTAYRRAVELGMDLSNGLSPDNAAQLRFEFGVTDDTSAHQPTASLTVDASHLAILPTPNLPSNYSLDKIHNSESFSFEDPLSVASQFLTVANEIITAMNDDIEARQTKLNQTVQAKEKISEKAAELRLESRLYKLQANQLDDSLETETQELHNSLQQLRKLGKPSLD